MKLSFFRILLLLLLFPLVLYPQKSGYKEYITQYMNVFNVNDTNVFNQGNEGYRLFVTGEYHFRKENAEIFMEVFTNLYKYANVRLILLENSMAHALILEDYLETGDESSLMRILNSSQFPVFHYQKLKRFYDNLPPDDKFHIVGVDIDNQDIETNFVFAVELLFREKEMPSELRSMLDKFPSYFFTMGESSKDIFEEIFEHFMNNKELYKKLLTDKYNTYGNLLFRVKKSINFRYYDYNRGQDSIPHTMRENFIYANAVEAMRRYPDCNYFGQFGLAHVGLTHFLLIPEEDGVESFVTKLNNREDSPVKGKVCSTSILYYDTKSMKFDLSDHKLFSFLSQIMYENSLKSNFPAKAYRIIKKNVQKDQIYILKLDNEDSPFKGVSEKKFQYVIIDT